MTKQIWIEGSDFAHHHVIIGTTRKGKSVILAAEAARLGITYDELLKRMEPTPEQREKERILQEERKQREIARLTAVCEAYWVNSTEDDSDLYVLHDALVCAEIVESPTEEQQKSLFLMLPSDIVGQGIAWGFSDTEVRENIQSFVEKNRDAVVARITSVS